MMYSLGGPQQASRILATALAVVMATVMVMVASTPSVPLTANGREQEEAAASAVAGGNKFRALKPARSAARPR